MTKFYDELTNFIEKYNGSPESIRQFVLNNKYYSKLESFEYCRMNDNNTAFIGRFNGKRNGSQLDISEKKNVKQFLLDFKWVFEDPKNRLKK